MGTRKVFWPVYYWISFVYYKLLYIIIYYYYRKVQSSKGSLLSSWSRRWGRLPTLFSREWGRLLPLCLIYYFFYLFLLRDVLCLRKINCQVRAPAHSSTSVEGGGMIKGLKLVTLLCIHLSLLSSWSRRWGRLPTLFSISRRWGRDIRPKTCDASAHIIIITERNRATRDDFGPWWSMINTIFC